MNFTNKKVWHNILLAVCCIIFISVIAIFVFSPGNRILIGTCGSDSMPMNYSNEIQPTFERSFLYEFGEQEPDRNITLPPMKHYDEKQQIINTLMNRAQITGSSNSVIGLYEFPDARLLIIDRNTSVTEVLETGDKIQTFILTPVVVGSKHYEVNQTGNAKHGAYNFSYENSVAITWVDLVLPRPVNATAPMYIVNKTYVEQDFYPDGRSLASITTIGTFYILYGQRVERVIGISAIILDPAWKQCYPRMEISGEGSRTGEMQYTVKFARSSERLLWSRLITTSEHIQQYDASMGSTNEWMSSDLWIFNDGTGCSC